MDASRHASNDDDDDDDDASAVDWPVAPPDSISPPHATIHCWRIIADGMPAQLEAASRALLSADEAVRADRFRRAADRHNFIAAHAGLRILLAAALGRNHGNLDLTRHDAGKPGLRGQPLEFNLSHSGNIVLIAITHNLAVGVDVEKPRDLQDRQAIAERFFHPAEAAELASLGGDAARHAFFRCWTRKEAVIKALGLGLSLPLSTFRVSVQEPARLLSTTGIEPAAAAWSLMDLRPAPDYVGAVAVPAAPVTVVCRTLDLAAALPRAA